MHGLPVTIRTLDPPLHEFLPKREELMVEIAVLKAKGAAKNKAAICAKEKLLRAVEELTSSTPCSATAAAGWASPTPRSPDAGPGDLRGGPARSRKKA